MRLFLILITKKNKWEQRSPLGKEKENHVNAMEQLDPTGLIHIYTRIKAYISSLINV